MNKELKIEVPEGYEIDQDNSSFNKIVFKKKQGQGQAKRWEDLGEIRGYYFSSLSKVHSESSWSAEDKNKNIFATREQVEGALALAQLTQLVKAANDGEVPAVREHCYKIYVNSAFKITRAYGSMCLTFLRFKSEEIRNEFIWLHKDLILTAARGGFLG